MDEPTTQEESNDVSIQVGVENGNVVVLFGQRISTLGLPPEAARQMGRALIKHANEADQLTKH